MRSSALCTSSMRSAGPAKITVWSPTTEPPRSEAKPMSPAQRAPVTPSRPRTERWSRSTRRPSAAARPNISAVPEGASIFLLWCISRISMSKSSSSVFATCLTSAASRLTPMLMLPDLTITARFAACSISFSFSPVSPVVPMTWTQPLRAVCSAKASVAAGTVKSRSPSAWASSGSTSVVTATPFLPSPASSPASRPITAEEAASTAPARTAPSVAAMAWTSVHPMRPPAPATISRMSDMASLQPIWLRVYRGRDAKESNAPHPPRVSSVDVGLAPRRHPLGLRVTAFDDEEIELGFAFAQRGRGLVLRRAVAIERDPIARKFEHDGAPAHVTLHHLTLAAAHQEAPAIFTEGRHVGDHVSLVTLGLGDIDVRDPIAFAGRGCRLRRRPVRLHAVVALDDHEIANRMGKAQRLRALVFRGAVACERGGVVRKFAQHIARAAPAFHHLLRSAPHQRAAAVLVVGRRRCGHVGLVPFRIAHIDMRNPIALGHLDLPVMAAPRRRFRQ